MVGRYRQLKYVYVGQGIKELVDKLKLECFTTDLVKYIPYPTLNESYYL